MAFSFIPTRRGARPGWRLTCLLSASLAAVPTGLRAQVVAAPVALGTSAPSVPYNALPSLGDMNSQSLSPAAERRLGDRIMRAILRDPDVLDDPLVLEHVQLLWTSLLTSARQRGDINADIDDTYAWRPFLVRERSVNAFALPGGYIGVHLGLLALTRTPDELASVLAHEMSHVTQRHIARMMSQSKQTSWMGLAAMVLGALAASRSSEAAQALIIGGQGAVAQGQLNFSRDMEREADRVGFGVLTEAGYAPAGMARMFEQLQTASRLNDDNSYPYLRSHPLTTERIGEARARMGMKGWGRPAPSGVSENSLRLRHAMMSVRARVLMDTRTPSLEPLLRSSLPSSADVVERLAERYGALLAAIQLRERTQADAALRQARALLPDLDGAARLEAVRLLELAAAELNLALGRREQGHAALTEAFKRPESGLRADGRPELLLLARLALSLSDTVDARAAAQDVANRLQPFVGAHPDDAAAWALLSSAWNRLGHPLRAIRAEAEAAAAIGDLQGAIDRVDAARKRARQPSSADLIELSVMDARMARWRQTLKEDARDQEEFS